MRAIKIAGFSVYSRGFFILDVFCVFGIYYIERYFLLADLADMGSVVPAVHLERGEKDARVGVSSKVTWSDTRGGDW